MNKFNLKVKTYAGYENIARMEKLIGTSTCREKALDCAIEDILDDIWSELLQKITIPPLNLAAKALVEDYLYVLYINALDSASSNSNPEGYLVHLLTTKMVDFLKANMDSGLFSQEVGRVDAVIRNYGIDHLPPTEIAYMTDVDIDCIKEYIRVLYA